jgi:hypothetical protein
MGKYKNWRHFIKNNLLLHYQKFVVLKSSSAQAQGN